MKFEFGERVRVTGYLVRGKDDSKRNPELTRFWRVLPLPKLAGKEGIFLGYRTLSDGYMNYSSFDEDGESDYYFHPKVYHKGACICIKGRKPENVFLSQIEKLNP